MPVPSFLDHVLDEPHAADLRKLNLAPSTPGQRDFGVSAGRWPALAFTAPSSLGTGKELAGFLLLVLIAGGLYLLSCRIWPYGPCLACRVDPRRNPGSNSRRHGRCRVCRGTGERLRFGTRLIRASGYKGGRWPK
jgi:hypothetical protein